EDECIAAGGELVGPGLDDKEVGARLRRRETRVPAIIVVQLHRHALPVRRGLRAPQQGRRDDIVPLAKNIGPDLNTFARYSFYRVATAVHAGENIFDDETRPGRIRRRAFPRLLGQDFACAPRYALHRTVSLLWSRLTRTHRISRKFPRDMDDLAAKAGLWGVENGYHDVFGNSHGGSAETQRQLIAALSRGLERPPEIAPVSERIRAFQGDGRRYWALGVQLYALRSHRNWGHGDFTDLARLIPLAASCGAAAIGLNPLHALFPDRAQEASPYAPNSRIFLNPLYIDLDAIPEFPGAAAAGIDLEDPRTGDLIDYEEVARAKVDGLRLAYEHFVTSARPDRRADF